MDNSVRQYPEELLNPLTRYQQLKERGLQKLLARFSESRKESQGVRKWEGALQLKPHREEKHHREILHRLTVDKSLYRSLTRKRRKKGARLRYRLIASVDINFRIARDSIEISLFNFPEPDFWLP
jgi:hypothetical protein